LECIVAVAVVCSDRRVVLTHYPKHRFCS